MIKNGAKWSLRSKTKSASSVPTVSPVIKQKTKKGQRKGARSRNHTLANSMPAVHIRTQRNRIPLNINAIDAMGRTAIEIAVDNENLEIVQLLLMQPDVRIGNALLCSIREGVYELAEALINHPSITKEMLGEGWAKYLDPSETATSEYSSDISPVILAAHLNQFEILQMLLRKDAIIEKPHKHYCSCEACEEERISDGLHRSLKRINTFRALASPAWISLTSSDPILSAFKLSRELQKRAKVEDEFKDQYLQLYGIFIKSTNIILLPEQCKQYAVDLLDQCRSTEEVMAVLNKEDNFCNEEIDLSSAKCSLARLKLAIKYEQKTVTFEAYRTQTGEIKGGGLTRAADRGPPPTAIEWLVFIWIVGMLWSEMKQLWQERLNKYWWNWLDFAMLCLYLCTISIRISAYLIYVFWNFNEETTPRHLIRTHWDAYEPMLVSEALFAVGNVFSFARDHADLEWKFHRSKLWIAHFDEGSTLSPPFNIIITPKACAKAARAIVNTIRWCFGRYHYDLKDENRATIRRPGYSRKSHCSIPMETNALKKPVTYIEIIQRLVSRFIHEQKKTMKMDGVNEDELKEIKQDISSLRFELRDDRRKEIVRSSSHIDAVKREIMRSMSTSTRARVTMPRRHFSSFKERGVAEIESEDSDDIEIRNHIDSLSTFGTGATLSPTFSTAAAQLLPPAITVGASGDVSDVRSNEHYYMGDKFNYAERQRPKHKTSDAFEFFVGETGSLRYRSRTEACQPVKDNTSSIISIEVIHRLRESINEQLNHLVDQIEHQHGDRISLEEYCENEVEQDDNGKDRETDCEVKLREIPSGKQKSSTKSSPSRVSFAGSLNISKKNEDS
uniref:Transient receptor ion channel domain-containing protein n=1 Tax=Meloidogyne javanica TaxID=6303 RepID=A0A915N0X1_MELJA